MITEETSALEKIHKNPSWCWLSSKEKDTLQKIPSVDVLKDFIDAKAQDGWKGDPEAFATRISPLLPEKIFSDSITTFTKLLPEKVKVAEYNLTTTKTPAPTIKAILLSKLESIILVIDTLIATFGVADFLKPIQGAEAQSKIFKLFIIISLASALASLVSPIGAGIFLLAIVVISLVWASIKPTPSELPHAINWTKELRNGRYATQGREAAVGKIAATLAAGNKHALIIGPSRSGKSVVAKDLAQRALDGEFPELAGKTFFYINSADLVGGPNMVSGKNPVAEIIEAMGNNYKNCVLVLDEAHTLCKTTGPVAQLLKTHLDPDGHFAHVIAITTDEEYTDYVKADKAFDGRFEKVKIDDTDEVGTKTILNNALLRSDTKPLCSTDAVDYIYEVSQKMNKPQPYAATQLLNNCIQIIKPTQVSSTQQKITKTSNEISYLLSKAAVDPTAIETIAKGIESLSSNKDPLQNQLHKISQSTSDLFQEKRTFDLLTKKIHLDTAKLNGTTPKNSKIIQLTLLDQLIKPALRKRITDTASPLEIDIEINSQLIDKVADLN